MLQIFQLKQDGTEVKGHSDQLPVEKVADWSTRWWHSHCLCWNGVTKITTIVRTNNDHQVDVEETDGYEDGEVDILWTGVEVRLMFDNDHDDIDNWDDDDNNGYDDPR